MRKNPDSWFKLDNAAKIYPAARRRDWMAMFRFSAQLTEPVDPAFLQQAVASVMPRFPSFAVRLRRGMFWFFLEHNDAVPAIQPDVNNPCVAMDPAKNKRFLFRVRYYDRRIAVEVYHVISDGTGGLCFLKTLVAEYLTLKYGVSIPRGGGILDCSEAPRPQELEDSFLRYAGSATLSRREDNAFYIRGEVEPPENIHITTGMIPVEVLLKKAKEKGVSLTEYLTAVLLLSVDTIQRREVKFQRLLKPVKVCIPVNLRSFFPSETLRNFALFVNPGIAPRLGVYTLDDILQEVHSFMRLEATPQKLSARISTNVRSEQSTFLRLAPLFLKNLVMKIAFSRLGDRKTSTIISNIGQVRLPPEMAAYVTRMDMMLGPLSRNRVVSAVISYGDTLYLTFTRTITDSRVEREFFKNLVHLGIPVKVESNNCY
jgi:hypothetical protein